MLSITIQGEIKEQELERKIDREVRENLKSS